MVKPRLSHLAVFASLSRFLFLLAVRQSQA